MENARVVTAYDFVHKNHFKGSDISLWWNMSITCARTHIHTHKGCMHPACEPQIYRVKKSRTINCTARPWRWRHHSPSELWNYSPSPIDTISSPRWWGSHCKGYQVYRSPDIPYPSPTMDVTFLKAPTVGQTMAVVQWSTKGLHNCAHTHQSLCCMCFY